MEEALKDSILGALEMVIDPELGIDIVNLGLVYKVNVDDEGVCTVDMTLTSMGCPMGPQIIDQVKTVLAEIPEIQDTEVNLVCRLLLEKKKMSRYAKIALGVS